MRIRSISMRVRASLAFVLLCLWNALLGLWAAVKLTMDWIGRSTVAGDAEHAQGLLEKAAIWLFSTPWWVPGALAALLTLLLVFWLRAWQEAKPQGDSAAGSPSPAPDAVAYVPRRWRGRTKASAGQLAAASSSSLDILFEPQEPFVALKTLEWGSCLRLYRVGVINNSSRTVYHVRVRVGVGRSISGLLPARGATSLDYEASFRFAGKPTTTVDINPYETEFFDVAEFHEVLPLGAEKIILACVPHAGFAGGGYAEFLSTTAIHEVALRVTADGVEPVQKRFRLWVAEDAQLMFAPFAA